MSPPTTRRALSGVKNDSSTGGIMQVISTILFYMQHVMGGGCCHVGSGLNPGVCVCVNTSLLLQEKQLNDLTLPDISDGIIHDRNLKMNLVMLVLLFFPQLIKTVKLTECAKKRFSVL